MATIKIDNNGSGRFTLSGELNRDTVVNCWPESKKELRKVKSDNLQAKLDLAAVSHVDTAGLAWLVNLIAEQKQLGQPISLMNCSTTLLKLAKISDVDSLLPVE